MKSPLYVLCLSAILVGGCETFSSTTIETKPANWAALEGKSVTVRGTAGNSELGPIVRFKDGGYVPLKARDPWVIDALARLVEVKGEIVSGSGFRAEKYVLDAKSIELISPPVKAK